jgi:plastocyanin
MANWSVTGLTVSESDSGHTAYTRTVGTRKGGEMRSKRRMFRYGLIVLPFVLAIGAAAGAGMAARASAHATKVNVTEKEYKITVARSLKAGKTMFVISNKGKLTHALDISGPGIAKRAAGSIAPGKSKTLTVTLKSGTYKIWCPVPGHAALGMKASVKVAGGSSGGTSGGGTTTGGGAWG